MSFPALHHGAPSPAFLAFAFEASSEGLAMLAPDGTLVALNACGAAMLGASAEARQPLLGRAWPECLPEAMQEAGRQAVRAALRGERGVVRGAWRGSSGASDWWEHQVLLAPREEGRAESLLVVSRNITHERTAADALERSARLHQALIEATSEIVWHLDLSTGLTERRGWTAFTGVEDDAANLDGWLDTVHPEDRQAADLATQHGVEARRPITIEYRLRHHAGGWRWVEDHATPLLEADGAVTDWIGIITDIHDRKLAEQRLRRSEERLRLALDSAALGTWEYDIATGGREWSAEARLMLGIPPSDAITDSTLPGLVHPADRHVLDERRRGIDPARSDLPAASFRIVRQDTGEVRWLTSRGRIVRDDAGRPVRCVGTLEDFTERKQTKDALQASLRRQQALIDATSAIVWRYDPLSRTAERHGWAEFTGEEADCAGQDGWLEAVHPEDRARMQAVAGEAAQVGTPYTSQYRLHHRSGAWRWVRNHGVPLRDEAGEVVEWVGTVSDIHDREVAEQALRKSEEHLRLAIEATGLGTWDVDAQTGRREWSPEFYDLLRLPRDTVPDRQVFIDMIHPDDRLRAVRELDGARHPDGSPRASAFRVRLADGEERWMEAHERTFVSSDNEPVRRVGTMQDITERKRIEHEVWTAAHTDGLTGVANRTLFQIRLDQQVVSAGLGGSRIALLLVDLDRFKEVNDTLGHDAGDAVLRAVAGRMGAALPPAATVARLGGDEFGVLLPDAPDADGVQAVADAMLAVLKQPMAYQAREIDCPASIGWSLFPDHDADASTLLKNADMALYAAKSAGRSRAYAFTPAMRDEMERRVNVLRLAKEALARGAVLPFYQPKISLVTGAVVGFEALLRWTDGSGLRNPGAIGEALADPELSVQLGTRMLDRVTADMSAWSTDLVPFGNVAINVAAHEFHGECLSQRVLGRLAAAGLRPEVLEIEVTESVLLDDGTQAIGAALQALHEAGVSVALDDFGTGYGSLTHLKRFPVSWLKIDRSFVSNLETDGDSAAIVRAVLGLARSIGIGVVAEGVETEQQVRFLRQARCEVAQGFIFAKPMAASRVPHFLASWSRAMTERPAAPTTARAPYA